MHLKSVSTSTRGLDLCLLLAVVVFAYLLLFKLPFYPFYTEADQIIFLYNADRMMHAEHMYRDFFQFTFPGGQVLYFLLFSIFGIKFWLLPFATILMAAAAFWFLLRVSKIVVPGAYSYLPPVLFIFFGFRWFGLDGSHRMFSPLFVLIAIQVLLKGRSFLHIASAGFFCALASYFTQQRGLIVVASIGAFIIADNYYRGWRWKTAAAESATLVVGFTTSLAALCAYFVATAGFDTFVNSTLVYPFLYYQFNEQNNYGVFLVNLQSALSATGPGQMLAILPALFYSFAVPLSIVIFAAIFFLKRKAHDWDFWRGPVLIAMVAGFAVFSMTNPSYLRFYQISAPCLVLVGWLLHYFGFSARRERLVFALTGLLLLFCAFQAYRIQTNWDYIEIDAPRGKVYALNSDQIHRYLWLQQHTTPGDAVFEVYEPLVYFLLDLRNPTRYTQIFPTDYTRPEFVAGSVEDLKKDPPRYILWDNSYNKPDTERSPGDHLGPLAHYLQAEYEPTGPVYYVNPAQPPIQIWVRTNH